ncbi:MAG: permease component of ribose/xylose/arabinose/galactoside ABC-type transporter, partial [Devosia sp.]|nr:permease component of ribose/xylose/arabinose/galactoside ABC-type transporter [Devosia sp.]
MADITAPITQGTLLSRVNWVDAGPFIALAVLVVVGFLVNPDFLSQANLTNVITR